MTRGPATTTERPRVGPYRGAHWGLLLAAGIACVVGLVTLVRALELPPVVDQLTFENPTRFRMTISVTTDAHDDWTLVGTVRQETTATFTDVIDQGEVWVFRFAAQGKVGGELRLSRAQLEESAWQVQVPPRIGANLEGQGAPFSP
jgi:hypothetical protein